MGYDNDGDDGHDDGGKDNHDTIDGHDIDYCDDSIDYDDGELERRSSHKRKSVVDSLAFAVLFCSLQQSFLQYYSPVSTLGVNAPPSHRASCAITGQHRGTTGTTEYRNRRVRQKGGTRRPLSERGECPASALLRALQRSTGFCDVLCRR